MVAISYRKKTYVLPTSYNELTGKQLIQLAPLLAAKEDPMLISLQVLRILLGMGKIRFFFLSLDMRNRMLDHISWVFDDNTLTAQLIPVYKRFYGPKAEFDNLTLGEYHCTEIYYAMLLHHPDQKVMDALVAVLYRRAKNWYNHRLDKDGDCRRVFNENEIEYWAGQIANWPLEVKQAIVLWYDGCRQHMIKLYPKVFKKPSDDDVGDENEKGMFGIMRGLADGAKYGSFESVKKLNLHTALMEMEKLVEEIEQLNKQANP